MAAAAAMAQLNGRSISQYALNAFSLLLLRHIFCPALSLDPVESIHST